MSNGESFPLLSIVVITRDRSASLARCLASLLNQDAGPDAYEIIVVDDGSTDDTPTTVERYRSGRPTVRSIRQEPAGIAAARNTGWRHAAGSLVAFVADDYELPPNYVSHVLAFFERVPTAAAVRFRIELAGDDLCSRVCHFYFDVDIRNNLRSRDQPAVTSIARALSKFRSRVAEHGQEPTLDHTLSAAGAAAFRVDVLAALDGFDERLVRSEDVDLARRMRCLGQALYYDPRLPIRRSYPTLLRKAFRSHVAAAYHQAAYEAQVAASRSAHRVAWALLKLPSRPIWRARQAGSWREALFVLPFLFVLEAAHCVGYVAGSAHARRTLRGHQPEDAPSGPGG